MAKGVCGPSEGCFSVLPTGARGEGSGQQQRQSREPLGKQRWKIPEERFYTPHAVYLLISKYLNIPEEQDRVNAVCLCPRP